jgi:uncharacterized protein YhfF
MSKTIDDFWRKFQNTYAQDQAPTDYTAYSFGNSPQMTDDLGKLVLEGKKCATTSLAWIYEHFSNEKIPAVGDYNIILNSKNEPLCIIQIKEVTRRKFSEVDEAFAYAEGEGDRSLQYWREAHWRFFERECKSIGRTRSENMPVLCEVFEVVFTRNAS